MKTIQTLTQLKNPIKFVKAISTGFAIFLLLFYSKSVKAGDVGVYKITAPVSSCTSLSNAEKVSIIVVNYGSMMVDTIPVAYTINNGAAILDTVIGGLGAGDSVKFTFKTTADLSVRGVYNIKAYTTLANDSNLMNDTASAVVNSMRLFAGFSTNGSCQGIVVNFNNLSGIDSGSLFYAWNFGDGLGTSTGTNPTYTYSKPGNYKVSLVVNSTLGCKDSVSHSIVISTQPVAIFKVSATCIGSLTVFSDSSKVANGGTIASTIWSFGDGDSSMANNPTHIYSTTGTYHPVLIVTTDSGCSATATDSIKVSPLPMASFMVPSRICSGVAVTFPDSSKGDSLSYLWSFSDSSSSMLQSPNHTFTKAGKYLIQLTVTSNTGCMATMTDSVTVHPNPVAAFSVYNVCYGDSARFTDMSTISDGSALTYNWNFGDTTTASYQNPAHLYTYVGTYPATETVTSNSGCSNSLTQSVTVNPLPIGGFTTTLDNTLTVMFMANDNEAGLTYMWDFGDGTGIDTGFSPSHTYGAQGIYKVTMTVRNGNGCAVESSDSVDVVSTGIKPLLYSDYGLDIYPNPFSGATYIYYDIPKPGLVNLSVYNENGKLISTIIDEPQIGGAYQFIFNSSGEAEPGLYLVKLSVDGYSTMKKIIEVK